LANIGPVFRVVVPMFLYFMVMFGGAFAGMWWYSWRTYRKGEKGWGKGMGYREAAVQSFTASSNNFVSSGFGTA
jgi:ACR3 family arsenite transporter